MSQSLKYRPDIDGLRAVAVLGVLFFHAGLGFPGGYTGVDVFFVISGFLITSIILRELREDRFSIVHFWERRVRRIIPAIAFLLAVVLLAGWFFLLPSAYEALGKQVVALILFSSNVKFWGESGYFDTASDEKPLLHTWTLSVEEQFYLILPMVLLLVFRWKRGKALFPLVASVVLGSFVLSAIGVFHWPSATFYLLPTRAWELGAGSLLAFAQPFGSARVRSLASWSGLTAILLPYFLYRADTPFPGLAALPPVLGTVAFIWAGMESPGKLPLPSRWLCGKGMVGLGLISYSLYLWHWPIFAFQKYLDYDDSNGWVQLVLALASIPIAWFSYAVIEQPFRNRRWILSRRVVFAIAGAGMSVLFAFSLFLWGSRGYPDRLPPQVLKMAEGAVPSPFNIELKPEDIPDNWVRLGAESDSWSVFVWGDSHAMAALPGIDRACKELGLSGRAATASSTAPVLGWYGMERYGLNEIAPVFGQKVVDELTAHLTGKRGVCILSANWERYIQSDNLVAGMDFETSLQETVRHLRQNGIQVVLLVDVPKFNYDPAKTLPVASLRKEDLAPFDLHPSRYEEYISSQEDLFARLSSDGVTVLRPGEYFRVGSAYSPIRADGTLLYRDAQHLSLSGGLALAPLFVEALENGLGEEVSEEGQKSLSEM